MINIEHSVAPEEVMAFLDGELSARDARAVSDHLEQCAECTALAQQLRSTSASLSEWTVLAAPARLEEAAKGWAAKEEVRHGAASGSTFFRSGSKRWKLVAIGGGAAVAASLMFAFLLANRAPAPRALLVRQEPQTYTEPQQIPERSRANAAIGSPDSLALADRALHAVSREKIGGRAELAAVMAPMSSPMIARVESLTILVKDVDGAHSSVESILSRYHGYSAQLSVNTPGNGPRGLHGSLRIPAAELASAIGEIKALGHVESESQSGEEVSQEHADLVARLKTARATEERFRAILEQRTGRVADVLEVEESIARVRGEIERMEAEQAALEHRVDFATVELQLAEEYKARLDSPVNSVSTRMHNASVAGYHNATETLLGFVLFAEEYGPSLLIWLAVLAVPIVLWRRYRRIRSRI